MLGKNNHTLAVEHIGYALFAIRSLELEQVSRTHELNPLLFQLTLKPTPIVGRLRVGRLIIDSATTSVAENHQQLFSSSQTALTSRSLKNRIGFLLMCMVFYIIQFG